MDKKDKVYIDILMTVSDIYIDNNRNYRQTLEDIMYISEDNDDTMVKMLDYIEKVFVSTDKKIKDIKEFEGDMMIRTGIDRKMTKILMNIFKQTFDDEIDFDVMLLIILPSLSIKLTNGIELYDFNVNTPLNKRVLKMVCDDEFKNDGCSICLEKCKKMFVMSNCCCNKTCLKCFHLNSGKCAICKNEKPIIIKM